MTHTADIQKLPRKFLPSDFTITDWPQLEPYFQDLLNREIASETDLQNWLQDMSELEAVIGEDAAWRQIRMTCDTENKELEEAFNYFVLHIQPHMQPLLDKLNRKLVDNPFVESLTDPAYAIYLRSVKKNIELFREANIPLQADIAVQAQQFGVISGKMTVEVDGKEYTLQQAAKFLESPDRALRETVYRKINERRLQDKEQLNTLFNTLLEKRTQVARNAGFDNYRDYKFVDMGRFDYTKEDCFKFHEAVKTGVLHLVDFIYDRKRQRLGLDALRQWDVDEEPEGVQALRPFQSGEELT